MEATYYRKVGGEAGVYRWDTIPGGLKRVFARDEGDETAIATKSDYNESCLCCLLKRSHSLAYHKQYLDQLSQ